MARIVAWALLVVALLLGAYASYAHQQINKQRQQAIAVVHDTITKDSAVYVHDTTRAADAKHAFDILAQPIRLGLEGSGPHGQILPVVVAAADTALSADSSALSDCNRLLAAKDSLTTLLVKAPPKPNRVTYFIEPLYSLADGTFAVDGGAELHLFGNVSVVGRGIVGQHPGAYAGLHITF